MTTGRFAPSPSGRMHLGNLFTALVSWLSVRAARGRWILRIEDLDPQRSRPEYARQIESDLRWLGLDWDAGGLDSDPPCRQSLRGEHYTHALDRLCATGLVYPCRCTRAGLNAVAAPHASDGRRLYPGICRPTSLPARFRSDQFQGAAYRLCVGSGHVEFADGVFGSQRVNLAREFGDTVVRRADGAWSYQLAVVVDDALMGVNEVVRGADLLLSSALQIYIYRLLGFTPPQWKHLPLVVNAQGVRLSKRDKSLSLDTLRHLYSPEQIVGKLACMAGIIPTPEPVSARELIPLFDWSKIPATPTVTAL